MKLLLLLIFSLFSFNALANCEIGSFYQPLDAHRQYNDSEWQSLEKKLQKAKVKEIFVQWTYADGSKLYEGLDSPIAKILEIGKKNNLKIWLGLNLDNDFWTIHQKNIDLIRAYFKRNELLLTQIIPEINHFYGDNKSFYGWYFTFEIDDRNWLEDNKKKALIEYLKKASSILNNSGTKNKPTAISAFANGKTAPRILASYWYDILTAANIKYLLFQDGIGAGKLSHKEFLLYRDIIANKLENKQLRVVVEAFTNNKSATPLEYSQRLRNGLSNSKTCSPIIFSIPDYFNDALMNKHLEYF